MPAILGKKLGMTQVFTEDGDRVPVTVIEAGPCTITQVKTSDRDGYAALQIGYGEVKERRVNKPLAGHFKKAGVNPVRHLCEIRVDLDSAAAWLKAPEEAPKKAKGKKAKAKAKEAEAVETVVEEEAEAAQAEAAPAEGEEETATAEAAEAEEGGAAKEAEAEAAEEVPEVEEEAQAPAAPPGTGYLITVEAFQEGQKVKVSGVSKGKGFAGVIKRHGFAGGPGSHGAHFHRAPGSVGASAYPSRVFKGLKLPGQMGNKKSTQRGLTVLSTDPEKNLLFIKGAVPGSSNCVVFVETES